MLHLSETHVFLFGLTSNFPTPAEAKPSSSFSKKIVYYIVHGGSPQRTVMPRSELSAQAVGNSNCADHILQNMMFPNYIHLKLADKMAEMGKSCIITLEPISFM